MTALLIDVLGWAGVVLILVAYLLLSLERLPARSVVFQSLNMVGSSCLVVNSGWHAAMPSVVLNVVWAGIGLFALARMIRPAPVPPGG